MKNNLNLNKSLDYKSHKNIKVLLGTNCVIGFSIFNFKTQYLQNLFTHCIFSHFLFLEHCWCQQFNLLAQWTKVCSTRTLPHPSPVGLLVTRDLGVGSVANPTGKLNAHIICLYKVTWDEKVSRIVWLNKSNRHTCGFAPHARCIPSWEAFICTIVCPASKHAHL